MSDETLSGPLPISGQRKYPFDVPGKPKLEFPFIRAGYWEAERRKFKAATVTGDMPQREVAAKVVLPRDRKRQEGFL